MNESEDELINLNEITGLGVSDRISYATRVTMELPFVSFFTLPLKYTKPDHWFGPIFV